VVAFGWCPIFNNIDKLQVLSFWHAQQGKKPLSLFTSFLKSTDCVLNLVCHANGKTPLEVSLTSVNNDCNNYKPNLY
jgi:hypothetical protein